MGLHLLRRYEALSRKPVLSDSQEHGRVVWDGALGYIMRQIDKDNNEILFQITPILFLQDP